jgi:nucleoside-diphosphate-sugar epimerase
VKVAAFGGTGFLGYDFVRLLLEERETRQIDVYSTSPASLSNVARHSVPIHLLSYRTFPHTLEQKYDYIVNFAHPWGVRDGVSANTQLDRLAGLFIKTLRAQPDCRLVHVSTTTVYEPFHPAGKKFSEDDPLRPPKGQVYARAKVRFDKKLLSETDLSHRMLLVRPSVIYGPFCLPFTDRILEAFRGGDVYFLDLGGRIQPILGRDVNRFIRLNLTDFTPGVFNLASHETLTWHDILKYFEGIAGGGKLVRLNDASKLPKDVSLFSVAGVKKLTGILSRDSAFKDLARPHFTRLPLRLRERVKSQFGSVPESRAVSAPVASTAYCRPYFGRDSLVSISRLQERFPDFRCVSMRDVEEEIRRYSRFRFSDDIHC